MTWINKNKEEIRKEITQIAKDETGLTSFKAGGVLRGIIETYNQTIYPLYQDVFNFLGGQFTHSKADGSMLDLRGRELGVAREDARKTEGTFEAEGTKSGTVKMGSWFVTDSGLRFKAKSDQAFHTRKNNKIEVEAEFPGATYNILADTPIRSTAVIDGIRTFLVPTNWISLSGGDVESDEDYRKRIKAKWESQGPDNRPGKYLSIALSHTEVNDAKVIRTPRGSGSIDLILGAIAGISSQRVCDEVRVAIGDAYLLTRDLIVKPVAALEKDFTVSYVDKDSPENVKDTLRSWLLRRKIGESVTMRALYQDALVPLVFDKLEFHNPTRDITLGATSKIVVRTLRALKRAS